MNEAPTLPPPPAATDNEGGEWDDHKFLHYVPTRPDGTRENAAYCGVEGFSESVEPTKQQLSEMPICPVCLALAKYDSSCRLPP